MTQIFLLSGVLMPKAIKKIKLRLKKNRFINPLKTNFRWKKLIKKNSTWKKQNSTLFVHNAPKIKTRNRVIRKIRKIFGVFKKVSILKSKNFLSKSWSRAAQRVVKANKVPLRKKTFLNSKLILELINNLLYKSASQNSHKTIAVKSSVTLLNLYKKVSWKMRTSRYAHWDLRTRGTLNEWRYNKLIGAELQFQERGREVTIYYLARFLLGPLTWKGLVRLLNAGLLLLDGKLITAHSQLKTGSILSIPYGPDTCGLKLNANKTWRKYKTKARKFTYLFYKHKKDIQAVPRIFKKVALKNKFKFLNFAKDPASGVVAFFGNKKYQNTLSTKEVINTTVLSLNNWRFRFD